MDDNPETSVKSEKSESSDKSPSSIPDTPKTSGSEDVQSESPEKREETSEANGSEKAVFEIPADLKTKPQQEESEQMESLHHSIKIDSDPPATSQERSDSPSPVTDAKAETPETDEETPATAVETPETDEETPETDEETPATAEETQRSSSTESSLTEGKSERRPSYFKKKRDSLVRFLTRRKSSDKDEEEGGKPKRRPSFVKRKLIALENELTMDNINKRATSIFAPDFSKKSETEEDKEEDPQQSESKKRKYLSPGIACLMLIGITTGSAMSNLPYFLKTSSWFGVFLNILLGINAMYAGLCLGWCWTAMEEIWPDTYLEYSRIPYQDIADRAAGMFFKYFIAIIIDITVLGTSGSYILTITSVLEVLVGGNLHFCIVAAIVAVCLIPFIMFSSYRNVKFIGIIDVLMSFLFTFLLIVLFFLKKPEIGKVSYTDPDLNSVISSFAGFSYAYGSGYAIPSVLADMEDRTQFTQALVTAYMVCIALYTILPILGYAAFGDNTPRYILEESLRQNENNDVLYVLSAVVIVTHVLQLSTTFVLASFPTLHAFEVRLMCPDKFGLYRVFTRIVIWFCLLVVILGVPSLPQLMDVVGATTINVATFILPPILYVCLICNYPKKDKRFLTKKEWFLIIETVFIGMAVLIVSTHTSIKEYGNLKTVRGTCYFNSTFA